MTRLDDLLDELTIDVPEAPTIDELRSRSANRHRRLLPLVAVLIGMVVVSGVLGQLVGNGSKRQDTGSDEVSTVAFLPGPRSFEISIRAEDNPVVQIRQFGLLRWDWIGEEPEAWGTRLDITSTVGVPVVVTAPMWERTTDEGILFVGNLVCHGNYLVCLGPAERLTLPARQKAAVSTRLYIQPRLAPPAVYSFTTQFRYEVPSTGERGTIPVDVYLKIWVPTGTEPADPTTSTIMPGPPPSPPTTT